MVFIILKLPIYSLRTGLIFVSGYNNGKYMMEYEVRDSEGEVKTGSVNTNISGF